MPGTQKESNSNFSNSILVETLIKEMLRAIKSKTPDFMKHHSISDNTSKQHIRRITELGVKIAPTILTPL